MDSRLPRCDWCSRKAPLRYFVCSSQNIVVMAAYCSPECGEIFEKNKDIILETPGNVEQRISRLRELLTHRA